MRENGKKKKKGQERRKERKKENRRYIMHEKFQILLLQNKEHINIRNGQRKIEE